MQNFDSYSLLSPIGLPNEELEIKDNQIFINGQLYQDTYAYYDKNGNQFSWQGKVKLLNPQSTNKYLVIKCAKNDSKVKFQNKKLKYQE